MHECIFADEYKGIRCFTCCSFDWYKEVTNNECKKCDKYISTKNGRKILSTMISEGLIKIDED